jgi:hypothetical protein
MEPGKTLLARGLALVAAHPAVAGGALTRAPRMAG